MGVNNAPWVMIWCCVLYYNNDDRQSPGGKLQVDSGLDFKRQATPEAGVHGLPPPAFGVRSHLVAHTASLPLHHRTQVVTLVQMCGRPTHRSRPHHIWRQINYLRLGCRLAAIYIANNVFFWWMIKVFGISGFIFRKHTPPFLIHASNFTWATLENLFSRIGNRRLLSERLWRIEDHLRSGQLESELLQRR